jgi:hypothetical protein
MDHTRRCHKRCTNTRARARANSRRHTTVHSERLFGQVPLNVNLGFSTSRQTTPAPRSRAAISCNAPFKCTRIISVQFADEISNRQQQQQLLFGWRDSSGDGTNAKSTQIRTTHIITYYCRSLFNDCSQEADRSLQPQWLNGQSSVERSVHTRTA